jgi:chromosome partitioning protein
MGKLCVVTLLHRTERHSLQVSRRMTQTERQQIRLMIASNAGGSGKTTTAVHLAYGLGKAGYSVTLIELDHNGSLSTFTGLPPTPENSETLLKVWKTDFDGNYPLQPIWSEHVVNVNAVQGGKPLQTMIREIPSRGRGFYILQDRLLDDFPLDSDVIIFDTPATLEPIGVMALVASTHVLCPIKPEQKDAEMLFGLLEWYYSTISEFKLRPKPEIIGFVPTRVDPKKATHRKILGIDEKGEALENTDTSDTLPALIQEAGIHCFPIIRDSNYYLTATSARLPLPLFRPNAPGAQDYDPIVEVIINLIDGEF